MAIRIISRFLAFFKIPRLTKRVWRVWQRNFEAFKNNLLVNFLPALLEPIMYLLAFGFGLGDFIPSIDGQDYINFISPALVAVAIMEGAFFECTFNSFTRMHFQKVFTAITATPVSIEEVVAGELFWGATRSTPNITMVLVVIAALGLISSSIFLLALPLAFLGGLMFASIAMCFTAMAPNIDFFNVVDFLFLTPMFFLSWTFFPLDSLPDVAQQAALAVDPLAHVVILARTILGCNEPILGLNTESLLLISLVWIIMVAIFFFILSINLMKQRLTK